jgi:hypothetical protein
MCEKNNVFGEKKIGEFFGCAKGGACGMVSSLFLTSFIHFCNLHVVECCAINK